MVGENTMNFTEEQKRIAVFLSSIGKVYTDTYLINGKTQKQFVNAFDALTNFIVNYAFERSGAPPFFRQIAQDALVQIFNEELVNFSEADAKTCWTLCLKMAGSRKLNKDLYPLNSNRSTGRNQGILNLMIEKNVLNIANWSIEFLKRDETKEIHHILKGVRGIGRKIASFYLRDLVWLKCISESSLSEKQFLQPIDLWVNRALKHSIGKRTGIDYRTPDHSYWKKAELIVQLCEESDCSPIGFNMGAWMLGARISNGESDYRRILKDPTHTILKQRYQALQEKTAELEKTFERTSRTKSSLAQILDSSNQ